MEITGTGISRGILSRGIGYEFWQLLSQRGKFVKQGKSIAGLSAAPQKLLKPAPQRTGKNGIVV